jgi:hypothetical protein
MNFAVLIIAVTALSLGTLIMEVTGVPCAVRRASGISYARTV